MDLSQFKDASEFKEYHQDAKELMPHKMPPPRGKAVMTFTNKITRKSHTGYILLVNKEPVKWMSKQQQTVETSAFSSKFIAMKQCIEDIEHLRFKLRMCLEYQLIPHTLQRMSSATIKG